MNSIICRWFLTIFIVSSLLSCEPDIIDDTLVDDTEVLMGKLTVNFEIKHIWIPPRRIVRVGLHVAESAQLLYQGDYYQSANVTDGRQYYTFSLPPGSYYYEAIIACICEGDSCSAGGFPGNQYGKKHIMGTFDIVDDEVTGIKTVFQ